MIRFTAAIDTSGVAAMLRRQERRIASASATALTRVAQTAKREIEEAMPRVFDRPTPFALRAVGFRSASKDATDTGAAVLLRKRKGSEPQTGENYLWPQVRGGDRKPKASERALQKAGILPEGWLAVPAKGVALDSYGNVPIGTVLRILAYFKARYSRYTQSSKTRRGRELNTSDATKAKWASGAKGWEMFALQPGARWPSGQSAQPGIYLRLKHAGTRGGAAVVPLMIFVKRANYRPRLPFYEIRDRAVARDLQREFDRELARISQD